MNEVTTNRPQVSQANSTHSPKSVETLLEEAQAAVTISNQSGADYGRWYNDGAALVAKVGHVAYWRDGLIVTMKVGEASLEAQQKIRAAFDESKNLLLAQRATLSSLSATAAEDDSATAEQQHIIAESEGTLRRLGEALTQESFRFSQVMNTWDEIAQTIAHWYSMPPSALWQTREYMSPSMFQPDFDDDQLAGDPDFD